MIYGCVGQAESPGSGPWLAVGEYRGSRRVTRHLVLCPVSPAPRPVCWLQSRLLSGLKFSRMSRLAADWQWEASI